MCYFCKAVRSLLHKTETAPFITTVWCKVRNRTILGDTHAYPKHLHGSSGSGWVSKYEMPIAARAILFKPNWSIGVTQVLEKATSPPRWRRVYKAHYLFFFRPELYLGSCSWIDWTYVIKNAGIACFTHDKETERVWFFLKIFFPIRQP